MTEDSYFDTRRPLSRKRSSDTNHSEADRLSADPENHSGDRAAHVVTMLLLGATVVGAAVKLGFNWTSG